jgi:ribosomal protein S18 acetylase RimI-like enzyme
MEPVLESIAMHDLPAADEVAIAAFREFEAHFDDWATFSKNKTPMTSLASLAEVFVAKLDGRVVGAVGYVAPGRPNGDIFDPSWATIRMLVVSPEFRGRGIGHALSVKCLDRAMRDGAKVIALHTSKIMRVALPMYERLGFRFEREVPPIFGVPYAVYVKRLGEYDA